MKLILNEMKKSFGSKEVLKDVSFTFEEGKIYGLLGRNGAGKTTLFNCLSEDIRPDAGTAALDGVTDGDRPLRSADATDKSRPLRSADVGYVLSMPILPEFLTGYEFVKFFLEVNAPEAARAISPDQWLDRVGIDKEDKHRLIKGYSHGMKNKLQMLGCFIASPPVILLDEPLTSLDVVAALEIKKMLYQIKKGRVLIFSTHILQLATDMCDEIVVLHDGRLELLDHDLIGSGQLEQRLVDILREEPPSGSEASGGQAAGIGRRHGRRGRSA